MEFDTVIWNIMYHHIRYSLLHKRMVSSATRDEKLEFTPVPLGRLPWKLTIVYVYFLWRRFLNATTGSIVEWLITGSTTMSGKIYTKNVANRKSEVRFFLKWSFFLYQDLSTRYSDSLSHVTNSTCCSTKGEALLLLTGTSHYSQPPKTSYRNCLTKS